jgi:hypothetical protein
LWLFYTETFVLFFICFLLCLSIAISFWVLLSPSPPEGPGCAFASWHELQRSKLGTLIRLLSDYLYTPLRSTSYFSSLLFYIIPSRKKREAYRMPSKNVIIRIVFYL